MVPTTAGLQLFELLRGVAPALVDPGTTAVWEIRLDDVVVGKADFRAVIDEIADEAARLITVLRQHNGRTVDLSQPVAVRRPGIRRMVGAGWQPFVNRRRTASRRVGEKREVMLPNLRERQVQAAARRVGLKLIVDCYNLPQTEKGSERYYLRPIWDARRVVRVLPDGGYELAYIAGRRRYVARPLLLDEVELLLSRWSKLGGADQLHVKDGATVPAHDDGPRTLGRERRTSPTAAYRMLEDQHRSVNRGVRNFDGVVHQQHS